MLTVSDKNKKYILRELKFQNVICEVLFLGLDEVAKAAVKCIEEQNS